MQPARLGRGDRGTETRPSFKFAPPTELEASLQEQLWLSPFTFMKLMCTSESFNPAPYGTGARGSKGIQTDRTVVVAHRGRICCHCR